MRWRLRTLIREMKTMKTPEWMRYGNLGLAFLLELAGLLSFAAVGVLLTGWMQLVAGIAGAVAFIVLWGLFAAPRSRRRLKGTQLLGFKIGMFAVAVLILVLIGQPVLATILAVLVAVNVLVARRIRQH